MRRCYKNSYHSDHFGSKGEGGVDVGVGDEEEEPEDHGSPDGQMGEYRPRSVFKARLEAHCNHDALNEMKNKGPFTL